MWKNINLEACLSHIKRQRAANLASPEQLKPAITISRQCGSGGRIVASKLVESLQSHAPPGEHWTVFDRELIKKVLEDHSLSLRLAEFLSETGKTRLGELLKKLGRREKPDAAQIVRHTVETIWQLAESGYVILVGRGANVITAGLKSVFHLRLVGSLENRIKRVEEAYDFDRPAAVKYIKSQDEAKKLYLQEYFGRDIEDPQLYHLIINTDDFSSDAVARLISDAACAWFQTMPARSKST